MEQKEQITNKFIELLVFEGWNQSTLEKACAECGIEKGYCDIIYPGRIAEFTGEFVKQCNDEALGKAREAGFEKLRTTQKVEEIIYQRIRSYHTKLGSLEALKKFIGYCLTPANLASSAHNIYDFSSEVWYTLGDRSTDFSYYTKRISLSGIYAKCMVYSMSDKSDNLQQTKRYIQKSIDGLMKINKLKLKIKDLTSIFKTRA